MNTLRVLVTGAAGFIGAALSERLLNAGLEVVGIDNLSPYYDVALKEARVARLRPRSGFTFVLQELADREGMNRIFSVHRPDVVVNLAAQAGVRYSLENPHAFVDSNVLGFLNILEGCRHHQVKHLIYASTSAVYGLNSKLPFSVNEGADHPISLYGATKRANELMAHSYSHLFELPTTGLRFFTVYGPWGRPDMALFLFTRSILEGKPVKLFNEGRHRRDFTYIDDVVEGIFRIVSGKAPSGELSWQGHAPDPSRSSAPFRLYNIGNHEPVELIRYLQVIEQCLGQKAKIELLPMQPGDVEATFADVESLTSDYDFKPQTSVEVGVSNFVRWYREYYKV